MENSGSSFISGHRIGYFAGKTGLEMKKTMHFFISGHAVAILVFFVNFVKINNGISDEANGSWSRMCGRKQLRGNAMRKTVHLCLSSHDEVMFRSEADLNMGFNCLALAVIETETRLMAEGILSTHCHGLMQSDSYQEVMRRMRYAYTRFFNTKYFRHGKMAEKRYFVLEVDGLYHTISAMNYVLRQGLHHGVSNTPFGYPHCSAGVIFHSDLGRTWDGPILGSSARYNYLPSNVHIPAKYRMSESGVLLREDVIDTRYVQELYITPRNYLFQMNKVAGDEDIRRQKEENGIPPVTMESIEQGVADFSLQQARVFEQGRLDRNRMTDTELCSVIDKVIVPRYFKEGQSASIYLLSDSTRAEICNMLWLESNQSRWLRAAGEFLGGKSVTEQQLRRCMLCPRNGK